ncbi:MAG TPA: O-antigen ligase family protein, partial [Bacteroidia bacterium]|nr:O-antigen ligase family protein [Bacteroidia bacterium]
YPWLFAIFIGFYMYHVTGLLWTSNMEAGAFDLEVKFSLFAFPWIYATRPFKAGKLDRILLWFVMGCSTAALAVLLRAGIYALFFGENKFFYTQLSCFMHPSYFSMYLNLSLLFMLLSLSAQDSQRRPWIYLLIGLHLVVIVLLSSKLGQISLVILLLTWLIWMIISRKKFLLGGGLLVLMLAGIVCLFQFFPTLTARLTNAFHAVSADQTDKSNAESTAVRMLVWGAAKELIAEHPLAGAGTGDSKDVLMDKYKAEGIAGAYAHNLNAHNAYLQIWVALGLIGFLFLLSIQVFPFAVGWKDKNVFLCGFILLSVLNFLPESMLEAQAGCMYYGFFNSLLLFSAKPLFSIPGVRKPVMDTAGRKE